MKNLLPLLLLCSIALAATASPNSPISSSSTSSVASPHQSVSYPLTITNRGAVRQSYSLCITKPRELAGQAVLSDTLVIIPSGDEWQGELLFTQSALIPLGGYEVVNVTVSNSDGSQRGALDFTTANPKQHPFLLATEEVLSQARSKVEEYQWAKDNLEGMRAMIDKYKFPEHKVITKPRPTKVWSSLNYGAADSEKAFQMALIYRLTGEESYRERAVEFIKRVTNRETGYLSIGAATSGVQVHEGNFFLYLTAACDLLYNEPLFSEAERKDIVDTFRLYVEQDRGHMSSIGIMNHEASANVGSIFVAMFLQDIPQVEHLINAPGGLADQMGKGVMDDGWWFESTINYCYLVAQRFTLAAQAFENYGWDLWHRRFPVKYKSRDYSNAAEGFTGMKFDNWGPITRSTVGLEDMITPYIGMMDHNAVVVSTNDSKATAPDNFYEMAYRKYRHDEIAWVLSKTKRSSWPALLYGVAELPEIDDPRSGSSYSPNIGIVALRSHKQGQSPEEQIQAYQKWGTHGGWHGHFDRASLQALDRNNHAYFGTEMVWYGYGAAGYKESVQTSATHNMVIVDELQQEAVPSEQLLFHAGDMMQVSLVETVARWREIPRHNTDKFPPWDDKEFAPDAAPVKQRRLMIVTDDYVVIADNMSSKQKHHYDWLIHPVGLTSTEGLKAKGGIDETLSTNGDSPYKYFTSAQWYSARKGAKASFEDGGNCLDVHTLWPEKSDIFIAYYPRGGNFDGDIRNNPERRSYGVRTQGRNATFLSVVEPYKGSSAIESIESKRDNELTVRLIDGRTQHIVITALSGEASVTMVQIDAEGKHSSENTNSYGAERHRN